MKLQQVSAVKMFDGMQYVYQHESESVNGKMNVAVYMPPQAESTAVPALLWLSGLTCTEQNFITKAGAQRAAADLGMAIIAPDTSPRGEGVANDEAYDLGQGAGFYLNATQEPWANHFQMYDYVVNELPELIEAELAVDGRWGISGHSMGGHGALTVYLKNQQRFSSCSAFSPIVAPAQVPWGQKAFGTYLGDDESTWQQYDATALVLAGQTSDSEILIDQGKADDFLADQLKTELFADACFRAGQKVNIRMQAGYDHSYYFISSFIDEHMAFHYQNLTVS
jgi:S-formylglutathione hydrolase